MRLTIFTTLSAIGIAVLGGVLWLTDVVVEKKAVMKDDYATDKVKLEATMSRFEDKLDAMHLDISEVKGDVRVFTARADALDSKIELHREESRNRTK